MWISYVLLALGFVFIGWLVYRLGFHEILNDFKTLGWNFFIALLPSIVTYVLFTYSWEEFLKGNGLKTPLRSLFMVKVVGEAVNIVNPLGWGGGDPVRIYMLKRWVPVSQATASVVVDRTLNSIALVPFMIFGIFLAFIKFSLPPAFKWGFSLSLLFIVGVTFYWYRRQHEGVFQFLIDLLIKLRIKRNWSEHTLQRVKEIDALISRFYTHNKGGFAVAFLLQFITRLLGVLEIYLVAYFLQAPIGWVASYLLASLTVIVNMIFVFIPGSVGVLEGAYAGVFHLLGQDPTVGTSIQIFRRIRMTLWAALGFYYIYHLDRKTRGALQAVAHNPIVEGEAELETLSGKD